MTELETHADRAHSTWSASATARNWTCSGAIAMTTLAGEEVESIHAARGTAAHTIADDCLKASDTNTIDHLGRVVHTKQHKIEIDEELVNSAQEYISYVRQIPADELMIEARLSLAVLKPPIEAGGTCDAIAIIKAERLLEVVDFKNGMGVVEVNENKQTRSYALMALLHLGGSFAKDIDRIKVTIVQPRAPHRDGRIRSETFLVGELLLWAADLMEKISRSKEALDAFKDIGGNRVKFDEWAEKYLQPGNCTFCPAEGVCPKLKKAALEKTTATARKWFENELTEVPDISNQPALESPEDLERQLDGLSMLESWIKAVRARAHMLADRGTKFDHWFLAESIGNRVWMEEDETKLMNGLRDQLKLGNAEILAPPKVRSVAQIEKAIGTKRKDELAKLENILWHKPVKGKNLVSADKTERTRVASKPEKFFETPTT